MTPRSRFLFCGLFALCIASAGAAVNDKPGAKDHPMVGRYAGSALINQGTISFEEVDLPLGRYERVKDTWQPIKSQHVEGKVSNYSYWAPHERSDLEVFRNYQEALAKSGFTVLFSCDSLKQCESDGLIRYAKDWTRSSNTFSDGYDSLSYFNNDDPPRFLVARKARAEGDVYVTLTVRPAGSTQMDKKMGAPYFLQVIEAQPMQTGAVTVDTEAMRKGLAADGKVTLRGLQFDTGSATILPASKPQLDAMAQLLAKEPQLKVFIVGHTDNVGEYNANLALSQRRAEAVVAALTQQYKIAGSRLMARGVANVAPAASNTSEGGRAANRRVELVAQ